MPSDKQVLHDVIDAFELLPGLRSSRLFIDVKGRVVTIRGHVPSVEQRQNAVRIARGIVGLRALVLEVGISSPPPVQAVSQKDTTAKDFG
jgi:osmotically-inducible protein OsmY